MPKSKTETQELDLTQRMLVSTVIGIGTLHESVTNMKAQIFAPAMRHGIEPAKKAA